MFSRLKALIKRNKWLYNRIQKARRNNYDKKNCVYFDKGKWNQNRRSGEKIRVVFICQYIPSWNKLAMIYQQMLEDDRYEPILLCLPIEIQDNLLKEDVKVNGTYNYFLEHNLPAVNALQPDGSWVDLKELHPDYVVYTRPYNYYLPKEYTTTIVSEYSRPMIMMYGTALAEQVLDVEHNDDFFNSVYLYFAEDDDVKKRYIEKYPYTIKKGLRKCIYCGYPCIDQIVADRGKPSPSWEFSKNSFRILWTPRWTTDPALGGSNFFVYYKSILEFARNNPNVDILIRPHPLAFENFVRTGEMTEKDVLDYKNEIEKLDNTCLDESAEYDATMWNSTVLVSDISAFMSEYSVTEKPIIYCSSNMYLDLLDSTKQLIDGCYTAENENKMYDYLNMLMAGEDPKKEQRSDIYYELYGKYEGKSVDNILEYMSEFMNN